MPREASLATQLRNCKSELNRLKRDFSNYRAQATASMRVLQEQIQTLKKDNERLEEIAALLRRTQRDKKP